MVDDTTVNANTLQSVAVGDRLYALPKPTDSAKVQRFPLSGARVFLFCLALSALGVALLDHVQRLVHAQDDESIRRVALIVMGLLGSLMVVGYLGAVLSALGKGSQVKAPFTTLPLELREPNARMRVRYEGGSSDQFQGTLWVGSFRLRFVSPQTVLDLNKRDVSACLAENGVLRLILKSQPKGLGQITVRIRIPSNPETRQRLRLFRDAIRALPDTTEPSIVPAPCSQYYKGSLRQAWVNLIWAVLAGLTFTPVMMLANQITDRSYPAWQVALGCTGYGSFLIGSFTALPIFMERLYAKSAHKLGFPMPKEPGS